MSLSLEELKRLQGLSLVEIDEKHQDKFISDLDNIIGFLQDMQNIDIPSEYLDEISDEYLTPVIWVDEFADSSGLLNNVEHEIINNSIVVKSALNNDS